MLTEGRLVDWISVLACCHWLAFPLHVVPEGAAEAFLAIDATLVVINVILYTYIDLDVGIPCRHMRETYLDLVFLALLCIEETAGVGSAPSVLVNHRLAIDKDFEVADRLDIEEHLASLLWTEHCLIDS